MNGLPVVGMQRELALINQEVENCFRLKLGQLGDFVSIEGDRCDRFFFPAIVLLAAKSIGAFGAKALELATAIQLIVLANRVHHALPEPPGPSVLVGDYLYSCFNRVLCSSGNIDLLGPLANLIQELSKLCIRQLDEGLPGLIRVSQQESFIAGTACAIAASLGSASKDDINRLKAYGEDLGYAWAWYKRIEEDPPPGLHERLERATLLIRELAATSARECLEARQNLIGLVLWMTKKFSTNKRYMVS